MRWLMHHRAPWPFLRVLARIWAGTAPKTDIPLRVLNPIEELAGPCGLQQVKSVWPSGPPCFMLTVAPPLLDLYPPYLFITPVPTCLIPQSHPIVMSRVTGGE
ncbi:hypothetical protein B0H16DRAFT_1740341 [Mycena metata]|uniref:Secreted protein n=1 Tax=Mycena metata TaxID=1033252 RepID=A0AAD7HCZ2_9AGAR|nr:hypothetical protein B0H16DRAFT_1740341 [Mycena metata]